MAIPRLCSIPDCGKLVRSRGWCTAHYTRWHRHGDPLGGGTVRGEPERYFREVIMGYEGDDCLPWPFKRAGDGYGQHWRDGEHRYVHRLVCKEVHGAPPTPDHQAAHSCGNGHKACCTKRHLDWKTPLGNTADKLRHGTHVQGESQNGAVLSEAEVREIRSLKGWLSQRAIGELYGVTRENIRNIHLRKTWGHVI